MNTKTVTTQSYYHRNKEKVHEQRRNNYKKNSQYYKDIVKKCKENRPPLLQLIINKKSYINSYKNNIKKTLIRNAKARAKRFNLEFNLTEDDINIPELCPYLKTEFIIEGGKGRSGYAPSIDRVDNSKGYLKDNIEIISDKANKMKQDATKEELINFASYIISKFN